MDMETNNTDNKFNNTPLIHCDGLVKIYKTTDIEVMALQGLDFDVYPGELLAIIGKSGSGKSTLLNILGGLETPTAGSIALDGVTLNELPEKQLCKIRSERIGYVWQKNTDNLLQYLTVVQNVEMPLLFSDLTKEDRESKAKAALDKVGLSSKYYKFPTALSGGEQQRVAIATAIVNEPDILLMDEPTGAVDKRTSDNLQDLFRKLNRETGITIIIVTHDISLADKVDRVVMISDGKISSERILTRKSIESLDHKAGTMSTNAEAYKQNTGSDVSDDHDEQNLSYNTNQYSEETSDTIDNADEITHEEFMILDKAGRVRLSPEMREAAGINSNRVRIDVEDGKIIIRPE